MLKPLSQTQQKYQTNAAAAQPAYQSSMGAINPAQWEQATAAAQPVWEQGVQAAVAAKSFASGVSGKGQKLVQRAQQVGGQRYAQGVSTAGPAWAAGFSPYHDTIAATLPNLPGRGPRGDPRNQQRANAMATALHQRRMARAS